MALGGGSSCRSRDLDCHPELELLGTARFGGLPYLVPTRSSVPFADGEPLGQWLVSTSIPSIHTGSVAIPTGDMHGHMLTNVHKYEHMCMRSRDTCTHVYL